MHPVAFCSKQASVISDPQSSVQHIWARGSKFKLRCYQSLMSRLSADCTAGNSTYFVRAAAVCTKSKKKKYVIRNAATRVYNRAHFSFKNGSLEFWQVDRSFNPSNSNTYWIVRFEYLGCTIYRVFIVIAISTGCYEWCRQKHRARVEVKQVLFKVLKGPMTWCSLDAFI